MADNPFANLDDNPYQAPLNTGSVQRAPKGKNSRHGCVTAWLGFALVVHVVVIALMIIIAMGVLDVTLPVLDLAWGVVSSTAAIVCVLLLWNFKKAGFYGIAILTVLGVAVSIATAEPGEGFTGHGAAFGGVALLYGILQLGKPSTWEQLK